MKRLFAWLFLAVGFAYSAFEPIELKGGSIIQGEVASWDGQKLEVKAEFGNLTFKRDQLSEKMLQKLSMASGDSKALQARIAELEATVASLRRDNAALRQQLQGSAASAPVPVSNSLSASPTTPEPRTTTSREKHTISSTGKRHNSSCRYYGSGRPCGPSDGVACKTCGG